MSLSICVSKYEYEYYRYSLSLSVGIIAFHYFSTNSKVMCINTDIEHFLLLNLFFWKQTNLCCRAIYSLLNDLCY